MTDPRDQWYGDTPESGPKRTLNTGRLLMEVRMAISDMESLIRALDRGTDIDKRKAAGRARLRIEKLKGLVNY